MQKTQKRLGRGLSALISVDDSEPRVEGREAGPSPAAAEIIRTGDIRPNPHQPRREIEPVELQALAASIQNAGIIQPIVVRPAGEGVYELIAGERRWRAAQMAGLDEIPAVVREATDEQMLELALVENIFREDLNAIDRAAAYQRYRETFGLSAEDIAARLGEDRSTVANYLRLLDLPSEVKQWVAEGKLSMGHARCLLALRSPEDITKLARRAIEEDLSVRILEKLVRDRVEAKAAATQPPRQPEDKRPQIRNLEQAFVEAVGTKVEIHESRRKGSGRIVIHYYSLDDFDRISERLGVGPQ